MKWPRYSEMFLSAWLIASAFVMTGGMPPGFQLVNIAAGALIFVLDVLSATLRARYAYLGVPGVAAALLLFSYFALPPEPPGTHSNIIVGLLLLIFGILPTEATEPPPSWREFRR